MPPFWPRSTRLRKASAAWWPSSEAKPQKRLSQKGARMKNYIAVIFSSDAKAHAGLRALWNLDREGELTVHGAAVIRRDDMGHIRVADRNTDLGMRTAMAVGIGTLLGLIAGPIGVAAGVAAAATLGVGTAVTVGGAGWWGCGCDGGCHQGRPSRNRG